jgi:hypothetical protein
MTVHSVTWPAAVTGRGPLARVRRLSLFLTRPFAPCLERALPSGRFAHVVAGCGVAIFEPGGRPGRAFGVLVHRSGSSAAIIEYGQPGIICACPFPRPQAWQNNRSALVAAPGRSQLLTSSGSINRPSAAR